MSTLAFATPMQAAPKHRITMSSSGNAPASLVIAKLLTPTLLRSAGLSLSGVQDDGGADSDGTFATQANTPTSAGSYTLDLTTYPNAQVAKADYKQLASSGGGTADLLKGAGDQATSVNLSTYVRRGSQILSIMGQLSAATNTALAQAKENGTLDQSTIDAANATVQKDARTLATVIGHRLNGHPLPAWGAITYFARFREPLQRSGVLPQQR